MYVGLIIYHISYMMTSLSKNLKEQKGATSGKSSQFPRLSYVNIRNSLYWVAEPNAVHPSQIEQTNKINKSASRCIPAGTPQGRQREPSIKTLRSPLSAEF